MKIVLEAVSIFLICFVLALFSTLYGLIKQHVLMATSAMSLGPSMVMTRNQRQAITGLVAPFVLYPLGAVVQNQLHHTLLAPLPGLLITGLFIAFPFFSTIGWLLLGRKLDRWTRNLPWNRPRKR
jgi:hypothetical protein